MFANFGGVVSTRILRSPNGISRGVGFVRMESKYVCETVINSFNNKLLPGWSNFAVFVFIKITYTWIVLCLDTMLNYSMTCRHQMDSIVSLLWAHCVRWFITIPVWQKPVTFKQAIVSGSDIEVNMRLNMAGFSPSFHIVIVRRRDRNNYFCYAKNGKQNDIIAAAIGWIKIGTKYTILDMFFPASNLAHYWRNWTLHNKNRYAAINWKILYCKLNMQSYSHVWSPYITSGLDMDQVYSYSLGHYFGDFISITEMFW